MGGDRCKLESSRGWVPFGLFGDILVVWYGGYKVVDSWIFPFSVDVTEFFFSFWLCALHVE